MDNLDFHGQFTAAQSGILSADGVVASEYVFNRDYYVQR